MLKEIEAEIDSDGCWSDRNKTIIKQLVRKAVKSDRKVLINDLIKFLENVRDEN